MVDDSLLNKAGIIERTLKRVDDEYRGFEHLLESDMRRQDSIVLNLQRACQAAIDGAMQLVRKGAYGLPQQSRDAFALLRGAGVIDAELAAGLMAMVGFRNVAVHAYEKLSLPILRSILDKDMQDLRVFARLLVETATSDPPS